VTARVSIGYTHPMTTKDSGLRIRVQRDLRDQFLAVCQAQDKPAAQVIREFMREYIEHHSTELGADGRQKERPAK
jgi:lipase chaperone LimK